MITSPTNDKVKFVRALSQRKHRLREGRFVIEGARLIDDALAAGLKPDWAFCAERLSAQAGVISAQLRALQIEMIPVSDAVLKACSDTETPQGILAVMPIPQLQLPAKPNLILIVDALRDPGNLGTLLRSAAAAGVDEVWLAPGTVDAYNPKVVRGAMGAHFRVPIQHADWLAITERVQGLEVYLAASDGDRPYTGVDWRQSSALIVGGEAEGASEPAAQLASARIVISLARSVESLNAAVAGSVILFEAKRQRDAIT